MCAINSIITQRFNISISGFLLNKKVGMHQPQRIENAKILIANTPMDTDKIKVFGSRVKVERVSQVAEIELAEKEKMKDKVRYYTSCTFPFPICTRPNQPNRLFFIVQTS